MCETFESSAHQQVHVEHGITAVPVDLQHRGQAVDHAFSRQQIGHVELGAVHQQLSGESRRAGVRRSGGEERAGRQEVRREQDVRRSGDQEIRRSGGQEIRRSGGLG